MRHLALIGLLATLTLSACTAVPAGYRGVKVRQFGDGRGNIENLGVGRYPSCFWQPGINCEVIPVTEQEYTWTLATTENEPADESISFQDQDGLLISGDFGIRYTLKPDMVDELYGKYRMSIEDITDIKMRNTVRDALNQAAGTMPVDSLYGTGKQRLMATVLRALRADFGEYIEINRVYVIGGFRVPQSIQTSIDAKIASTQRAMQREFEVRETQAQAEKDSVEAAGRATAVLIAARAQAEANREIAASISETLVRYEQAKKWNGVMPTVTAGSSSILSVTP